MLQDNVAFYTKQADRESKELIVRKQVRLRHQVRHSILDIDCKTNSLGSEPPVHKAYSCYPQMSSCDNAHLVQFKIYPPELTLLGVWCTLQVYPITPLV